MAETAMLVTLFATETLYSVLDEEKDGESLPGLTERADNEAVRTTLFGLAFIVTEAEQVEASIKSPFPDDTLVKDAVKEEVPVLRVLKVKVREYLASPLE